MLYEVQKNSFKKAIKTPMIVSREAFPGEAMGPFEIPSYHSRVEPNEAKIDRLASFILSLGKSMATLRKCLLGEWEWSE